MRSGSFELVNQPLSRGDRQGTPAVIGLPSLASAVDCSNVLSGGDRIVVYRETRTIGIDEIQNQVFLQRIRASTGKDRGGARSLTPLETRVVTLADSTQSVAIDPQGMFVLYTATGECGKKVLKLQMLDAGGGNSSSPTVIFGCTRVSETQAGVESIDISMADIMSL